MKTIRIYPTNIIDFILIPEALESYELMTFNEDLDCFELELDEDESEEETSDQIQEALSETTASYRIENSERNSDNNTFGIPAGMDEETYYNQYR